MEKCWCCDKNVDITKTLYKRKHKGKIYCFCSQKCKRKFDTEKGLIVDML